MSKSAKVVLVASAACRVTRRTCTEVSFPADLTSCISIGILSIWTGTDNSAGETTQQ